MGRVEGIKKKKKTNSCNAIVVRSLNSAYVDPQRERETWQNMRRRV